MTSPIIIIIGGFGTNYKYMVPFVKEIDIALQKIENNEKYQILYYPLTHRNNIEYETKLRLTHLSMKHEYIIIGYSAGCSLALTLSCHIKTLKLFLVNPIHIDFPTQLLEALSPKSILDEEESEGDREHEIGSDESERSDDEDDSIVSFLCHINDLSHDMLKIYNGTIEYPIYETENILEIVCNDLYGFYYFIVSYKFGCWLFGLIWNMAIAMNLTWIFIRIYYELYGRYAGELNYNDIMNKTFIHAISFENITNTIYEFIAKPNLYDLIEDCPCPIDIIMGQDDLSCKNMTELFRKIREERVEGERVEGERVEGEMVIKKNDINIFYMTGNHHILYFSPRKCAEQIIDSLS